MLWLWILIGVLVFVALVAVLGYNRLVRLRNEVDTGWANIDVQLQRRADLIPNLVETVRAYAAHERGVFEEVTRARAALQQAGSPGSGSGGERGPHRGDRAALRRRRGVPGPARRPRTSSSSRRT